MIATSLVLVRCVQFPDYQQVHGFQMTSRRICAIDNERVTVLFFRNEIQRSSFSFWLMITLAQTKPHFRCQSSGCFSGFIEKLLLRPLKKDILHFTFAMRVQYSNIIRFKLPFISTTRRLTKFGSVSLYKMCQGDTM